MRLYHIKANCLCDRSFSAWKTSGMRAKAKHLNLLRIGRLQVLNPQSNNTTGAETPQLDCIKLMGSMCRWKPLKGRRQEKKKDGSKSRKWVQSINALQYSVFVLCNWRCEIVLNPFRICKDRNSGHTEEDLGGGDWVIERRRKKTQHEPGSGGPIATARPMISPPRLPLTQCFDTFFAPPLFSNSSP